MMQYPSILSEKTAFINSMADKLGNYPLDYGTGAALSQQLQAPGPPHQTAGVMLLINYRQPESPRCNEKGEFFFSLIKRSSTVPQPGDISCPGGMLHPSIDPLLRPIFASPLLPIMNDKAYALAKSRDAATFRLMTLYLANALREAWEEIRLNPFHVSFIGPLPTHPLILFKRVIFPLVGMIKSPWKVRANDEVERIVEIPLKSFYDEKSFGRYVIEHTLTSTGGTSEYMDFPCLIQKNDQGGEDVLWGATFNIITNFLKIVLGYQLPDWQSQRTVRKTLPKNYISGGNG